MNRRWIGLVVLLVAALAQLGCRGRRGSEARADTRVTIEGRVLLEDGDGLNDLSRVRVGIGAGEGGVTLEEDGSFVFSDLEPDVYSLVITYSGGLTDDAEGSAYQRYERRVSAPEGAYVPLGDIALELGLGTVRGTVSSSDGASTDGAKVRLESDGVVREDIVEADDFELERVPVGRHQLLLERDGYTACAHEVVVAFHGHEVSGPQQLASTAVSLDHDDSQRIKIVDDTWYLLEAYDEPVTVLVDAAFATEGRHWPAGESAGDYAELASFGVQVEEGEQVERLQLRDSCGFESATHDVHFVLDQTPPEVDYVELHLGQPWSTSPTMSLTVPARDRLTAASADFTVDGLEMKIALCDETSNGSGEMGCDPSLEDAPWVPYAFTQTVTFQDRDGLKQIQVRVRDASENETEGVFADSVHVDQSAPVFGGIEVRGIRVLGPAGEDGVIHEPTVMVFLDVSGATQMKLGSASGLGGVSWQPFLPAVSYNFTGGDGLKYLHAQFRDDAGNQSEEYSVAVTLVTTATLRGTAQLAGGTDHSGTAVELVGTGFRTTTDARGAWELADVTAGTYNLLLSRDGYASERVSSLTLAVNDDVTLDLVTLLELDVTPPGEAELVIGDGSGVIHDPSPMAQVHAEGATEMKIGTTSGLATSVWQPFMPSFRFDFTEDDGTKHLYVRLRDAAGNEADELHSAVELVTTATLSGTVTLDGTTDHGGTTVVLLGTALSATTTADGSWTLAGVRAGTYNLEARHTGFIAQRQTVTLSVNDDLTLLPVELLEVDDEPPTGVQLLIAGGADVITDPSPLITLTAEGAARMKVGTTSGLAMAAWQPFQETFRWDFTDVDGEKWLHAVVEDEAGNQSTEVSDSATLNRCGTVSGHVVLLGETDHGGAQVTLLGTPYTTTTNEDGSWSLSDVVAGTFNLQCSATGFRTYRENSLYVQPAATTDLGEQLLDAYQAFVQGTVVLEGWEGIQHHDGAHVVLPRSESEAPYETYTDVNGNFSLPVKPTNYPEPLTITKLGYEGYVHPTTFAVGPDQVYPLGTIRLAAAANDLFGTVTLADEVDHSGISVRAVSSDGGRVDLETSTDAQGDYAFEMLPLGTYRVYYEYEPEPFRETYTHVGVVLHSGQPTRLDPVALRARFLSIEDGAPLTASQVVRVSLGCSDCLEMRVSNTLSNFDDSDWGWQGCADSLEDWDLGVGDGEKLVYGQFKTNADPSNPTDVVSDAIRLDTEAIIAGFDHDGGPPRVLGAGAVLRLTLVGEPDGRAHAVVGGGYDDNITLYDDGSRGDDVAGDGVYRRSYTIVRSDDVTGVFVTGYFTDSLGNAGFLVAPDPVTTSVPPLVQSVSVVPDPGAGTVTIQWQTDEAAHGSVLWGPEAEPVVYTHTDSEPAGYITTHSVTVGPADIVPGDIYHFQIQVADASGASSSTYGATFRLVHARPRHVVAIPGIDRNHVRWEASSMDPVWGYNVYRRVDGQEFDLDSPINPEPCGWTATDPRCNSEAWFYEDVLVEPGTTFHYVVAAVDPMGHVGMLSDETTATPCVASSGPTSVQGDIEGTTVWSECGSPYRMTGSVAVGKNVDGSVLVLGPNTHVTAMGSYQLMIRTLGRIAALGERGTVSWDETAGEYVESDDGMVRIEAYSGAVGAWRGVYFEFPNDGVVDDARLVDLENGEYYGGPVFYRTRVSHANESGIRVYERGIAAVRSTIQNNRAGINSNELGSGGGIFIGDGQLLLRWSKISQNAAGTGTGSGGTAYGGGIAATGSTCTIMDSRIAGNSVTGATWRYGGGMAVYQTACSLCGTSVSSPKTMLVRTRLEGNSLGTGSHASSGGGMYHWPAASAGFFLMQACVVYANTNSSNSNDSDGGGGVLLAGSPDRVAIVDSLFERNSAARFGGALLVEGSPPCSLAGNTFVDNTTAVARSAGDIHAYYSNSVSINASTHLHTPAFTGSAPMIRSTEYPGSSVSSSHVTVPSGQNGICVGYLSAVGNSSVASGDTAHAMMTDLAYSNPNINAHGNYWGPYCTAEMEAGGNPKNVSCIHDYYDDVSLAEVEYTDYALTAFPMPRVTAPRWWHKLGPLDSITFEGYGYDYEDAADLGCGDPGLAGGMWVSDGERYACSDADHDHWSCHRCPLDGPEYCPPDCYLGDSDLRWCKTEDDCDGPNELGWGQTLSIPASSIGAPSSTPRRIWLWAYDSNGQIGKVPTEVIIQ
ncbi:MAG: carboxypeptidase regulatory-like domain-containing protein [Polyangiaceae bacterium]|nr:carboxypeptidase regulatory-like domain-containing protein [Polyangiaceae bacterium]